MDRLRCETLAGSSRSSSFLPDGASVEMLAVENAQRLQALEWLISTSERHQMRGFKMLPSESRCFKWEAGLQNRVRQEPNPLISQPELAGWLAAPRTGGQAVTPG